MKKYIIPTIMTVLIIVTLIYINPITNTLASFLDGNKEVKTQPISQYARVDNYLYVDESTDFIPYSYQDLINIVYTFFNNGWDNITFYCPKEYTSCLIDIESILEDSALMTHINNYVHPYNSFEEIEIAFTDSGEITLRNNKLYSLDETLQINEEIRSILDEVLEDTEEYDDSEKLMLIHDYIINNTSYDQSADPSQDIPNKSNTAYGLLFNHLAICGGYADTMAIILDILEIPNYKIASNTHVWNAVYVENKWLHLDLTWDDPVNKNQPGTEYLYHKYFLVNNSTLTLEDGELTEHLFDKSIYLEFNY